MEAITFTPGEIAAIRSIVPQEVTESEFEQFLLTCQRLRLNPLANQIYCQKRGGRLSIEPSIDGLTLIADRTGKYAGVDEPEFRASKDGTHPATASVKVWKFVQGERCAFVGFARWSEYAPYYNNKLGHMWQKMPFGMLAKCAFSSALRKAFPNELSSIYSEEEMRQSVNDEYDVPASSSRRVERPATHASDFGGYSSQIEGGVRSSRPTTAREVKETIASQVRKQNEKIKEEKDATWEEAFVSVASHLGMNWKELTTGAKLGLARRLMDSDRDVDKVTTEHFRLMYHPLNDYLQASEGDAHFLSPEGMAEMWKEDYGERVAFPSSIYKLSGANWTHMANHLRIRMELKRARGAFFATCAEAGLWDVSGKTKEEVEDIDKDQKRWMSGVLEYNVTTRKKLTAPAWRTLTAKLKEEFNQTLAHNAEPEEEEEVNQWKDRTKVAR